MKPINDKKDNEKKYYIYNLKNNPDEYEVADYYSTMVANEFDFEIKNKLDISQTKKIYLYGYFKDNHFFDIVTGVEIYNFEDLTDVLKTYKYPSEWLAYTSVHEVEPEEVASQLREMLDENLVKLYVDKQNYVMKTPVKIYEEIENKKRIREDALKYLEEYKRKLGK